MIASSTVISSLALVEGKLRLIGALRECPGSAAMWLIGEQLVARSTLLSVGNLALGPCGSRQVVGKNRVRSPGVGIFSHPKERTSELLAPQCKP